MPLRSREPAPPPGTPHEMVKGCRCPHCDSENYDILRTRRYGYRQTVRFVFCCDCNTRYMQDMVSYPVSSFAKILGAWVLKSRLYHYERKAQKAREAQAEANESRARSSR